MSHAPRLGRPRDPMVDRAILEATRQLLQQRGYTGLRIAEVAARAGVTPPTVRLRWPTKAELVHDAIFRDFERGFLPNTGSLAGDLRAAIAATIELYTTPETQAAILGFNEALHRHPDLRRRLRSRVYEPTLEGYRRMLERAVHRGELSADAAPEPHTLMEIIAGTVLARVTVFGRPAGAVQDELVAVLLHGLQRSPESVVPGAAAAGAGGD